MSRNQNKPLNNNEWITVRYDFSYFTILWFIILFTGWYVGCGGLEKCYSFRFGFEYTFIIAYDIYGVFFALYKDIVVDTTIVSVGLPITYILFRNDQVIKAYSALPCVFQD